MAVMKEVSIEEYDLFRKWYLKYTNSRVLKTKQRAGFTAVIDKKTGETVCSESHLLGKSKYLIKQNYYDLYSRLNRMERINLDKSQLIKVGSTVYLKQSIMPHDMEEKIF